MTLLVQFNSFTNLPFFYFIDDLMSGIVTAECLQYDFSTIETATNCFAVQNEIGKGGFGDVYKVKSVTSDS